MEEKNQELQRVRGQMIAGRAGLEAGGGVQLKGRGWGRSGFGGLQRPGWGSSWGRLGSGRR